MCAASFKLSSYRSGSNLSSKMMDACVCSTCQNVSSTSGHWTLRFFWCKSYLTSDGWSTGWSTFMVSTVFDFTFPIPTWEMTSASRASMAPTSPAHASLWVRAGRAAGAHSFFLHRVSLGTLSTAEACAEVCCSTALGCLPAFRRRTLQGGGVGKPGSAVPGPCL